MGTAGYERAVGSTLAMACSRRDGAGSLTLLRPWRRCFGLLGLEMVAEGVDYATAAKRRASRSALSCTHGLEGEGLCWGCRVLVLLASRGFTRLSLCRAFTKRGGTCKSADGKTPKDIYINLLLEGSGSDSVSRQGLWMFIHAKNKTTGISAAPWSSHRLLVLSYSSLSIPLSPADGHRHRVTLLGCFEHVRLNTTTTTHISQPQKRCLSGSTPPAYSVANHRSGVFCLL